jgi:hypothetical protein
MIFGLIMVEGVLRGLIGKVEESDMPALIFDRG